MSTKSPGPRAKLPRLAIGAVAIVLVAAGVYYLWPRPVPTPNAPPESAPLPPLTTSPFFNTKPGVAYLGDQSCADCHQEQTRAYLQHPMGRSMFTAADNPPLERFNSEANNPFRADRFHFQVVRKNGELIHEEWCEDAAGKVVARKDVPIAFAVGSGTQARSYLTAADGFLFQSPITWYTPKNAWGLSPGYETTAHHFNRRIDSRCLYCHSHDSRPVEHTANKYKDPPFGQLAIGCERCHGPGELHVAGQATRAKSDIPDLTIVNPKHLSPPLRDNVCEQCHLQGESIVVRRGRSQVDYRPGLPLHEYMSVFVRPPDITDASKIVTHFEQMQLSTCAQKSKGRFTCTSCHDPHGVPAPAQKIGFYRQRCLTCHGSPAKASAVQAPDCSVPVEERTAKAPGDNCLTCHMPRNRSSNASHLAVTDHRVPRRPDRLPEAPIDRSVGDVPLVAYHRNLLGPDDEAQTRDLGLALVELAMLAEGAGTLPVRDFLSQRAMPLLDQSAARAPDDVPTLEARGFALYAARRSDEALKVLADALARAPDREVTLTWATRIAQASERLDLAEQYARRAVEKYPHYAEHHHRLAVVYVSRKDWPRAIEEAQAALKIDPFSAESRLVQIAIYLETGDHARARAEFDTLGVIHPDHRDRLKSWFEERLRKSK